MGRKPNYRGRCRQCGEPFVRYRSAARSKPMYCGLPCTRMASRRRREVLCAFCGKAFQRRLSQLEHAKSSGIQFCSRRCKDRAQGLDGGAAFSAMRPPHYSGDGVTYRRRALRHYGSACRICRYSNERVLIVHHKDGDRNNNKLDNLEVLCPTHHAEYHCGLRKRPNRARGFVDNCG